MGRMTRTIFRDCWLPYSEANAIMFPRPVSSVDRASSMGVLTSGLDWPVGLSESQNGFRALKTDVLRALRLRSRHTTIEQEMIVETLRKGYRMGEVPSHEYPRKAGTSHIVVWRHGWGYLFSLIRLMI